MPTTKSYKDFVLEQLRFSDDIIVKPMMGEYLLYKSGVLFGGIYDNRLLIKITESNKKYDMPTAVPYDGAKPMYLADDLDDKEKLKKVVSDTFRDLV